MARGSGRDLTRHEFDAVIRRAAELARTDPDARGDSLSEAELYRIARDVGLDEGHVQRALAEVRGVGVRPQEGGVLDRVFGPAVVHASRIVTGTPADLRKRLDDFFVATQLLEPVRRGADLLQYRPALDWASKVAQAASFTSKKHYVASARSVEVRLEAVDDSRTLVALTVDPGTRSDDVIGAVIGGGGGGIGLGIGATVLLTPALPLMAALGAAVVVGTGLATGITVALAHGHRGKVAEVRAEIEGILDRLEMGESLEPPPPSWRRWVKRHFHGVARDIKGMSPDDDDVWS